MRGTATCTTVNARAFTVNSRASMVRRMSKALPRGAQPSRLTWPTVARSWHLLYGRSAWGLSAFPFPLTPLAHAA
eukprot:1873486-Pyramimonas_sp.AAC.1